MGTIEKLTSFYNSLFKTPKVDMGDFEDRVLFQKVVYLAQTLGIGFEEYKFGWYVHGPYSPALTTEGYKLYASSENYGPHQFTESEQEKIEFLKGLFQNEIEKRDWNRLELCASILFCWKESAKGLKSFSEDELAKIIKEKKGWYTEQEIRDGIGKIKLLRLKAHS